MDKNLKLLLGATAGYLVLTHVNRPANVRGSDPGFYWQGKHIEGGQGSAITNIGSTIKTDYALVAASMINYALNKWGAHGPKTPKTTLAYALECVDYWWHEAGRYLGRTDNFYLSGGVTEPIGCQFRAYSQGTMNVRDCHLNSADMKGLNLESWHGMVKGYQRFAELLPSTVLSNARMNVAAWGSAKSNVAGFGAWALSPADAQQFWEAIRSVGIAFDVSKGTPTKETVWTAGWKAAKDTLDPAKLPENIIKGGGWWLGKMFANPTTAIILAGGAYLLWKRR